MLKKGNIVKLKKGLVSGEFYGSCSFIEEMRFKGKATVLEVFKNSKDFFIDKSFYWYTEEMVDVVTVKPFKLNWLKKMMSLNSVIIIGMWFIIVTLVRIIFKI